MARNTKQTGPKAAGDAARVLADNKTTTKTKSVAGSTLSQSPSSKGQTHQMAASEAAKILANPRSSKAEKSAAASALAQAPRRSAKGK